MSICMPLSDESFRLETGARPPAVRGAKADKLPQERIGALEERMNRLEEEQRNALDLVRHAMFTLQQTQAGQDLTHNRAIERLTARLAECESALTGLDARQKRDDEAMRERLFDMGETLGSVRAMAMAAVRPGALRKLERSLGKEIEASAGALRTEFGETIAQAVEAAESRSAEALEALEEQYWDDIIELARRFDGLADTVVRVRRELDERESEPVAASSPFSAGAMQADFSPEEHAAALQDEEGAVRDVETHPDVIPFPPQSSAASAAQESDSAAVPANVPAILCAAASRVEAAEDGPDPAPERGAPRGFAPLKRVASSAGSAVFALCIMGGLSLLAGPALGPSFQGAPPAFAHDRAGWSPVTVVPETVILAPHLDPVLHSAGEAHPVVTVNGATSGH